MKLNLSVSSIRRGRRPKSGYPFTVTGSSTSFGPKVVSKWFVILEAVFSSLAIPLVSVGAICTVVMMKLNLSAASIRRERRPGSGYPFTVTGSNTSFGPKVVLSSSVGSI